MDKTRLKRLDVEFGCSLNWCMRSGFIGEHDIVAFASDFAGVSGLSCYHEFGIQAVFKI